MIFWSSWRLKMVVSERQHWPAGGAEAAGHQARTVSSMWLCDCEFFYCCETLTCSCEIYDCGSCILVKSITSSYEICNYFMWLWFFCDSCDSCDCECDLIVNVLIVVKLWLCEIYDCGSCILVKSITNSYEICNYFMWLWFFCDSCDSCDCECDLIVNEVVAGAVWKRKEKKVRKEKVKKKSYAWRDKQFSTGR